MCRGRPGIITTLVKTRNKPKLHSHCLAAGNYPPGGVKEAEYARAVPVNESLGVQFIKTG